MSNRYRLYNYFLIFLGVTCGLLFAIYNPHKFPIDDGFFYLKIAQNILLYGQSSFHNITNTNGYHPLWQFICILITNISSEEPDDLLRTVFIVQTFIFSASLYLVHKISKIFKINEFIPMGILTIIFIGKGSFYLMETFIVLFFLLLCINIYSNYLIKRESNNSPKIFFITSILSSLLVFSRLDLIFFVSLFLGVVCLSELKKDGFKKSAFRLTLLILPLFLLLFLYMYLNYYNFGIFFPISGLIKSYDLLSFSFDRLGILGIIILILLIFSASIIFLRKLRFKKFRKNLENIEKILLLLLASNLIFIIYITLYIDAAPWYFVLAYVYFAFFVSYIIQIFCLVYYNFHFFDKLVLFLIIILIFISISFSFLRAITNFSIFNKFYYNGSLSTQIQTISGRYKLAKELENFLEPGTSILVFDTPGILAFYTRFNIFPSDGLMNDARYSFELIDEGALNYFCKRNVNYVLAPMPSKFNPVFHGLHISLEKRLYNIKLTIYSPILKKPSKPILLNSKNLTKVFDNPLNSINKNFQSLGLWKFLC